MSEVFLEILNSSITASYLIIAVIILRIVLKKAPKWSICLLWAMVAIRLVMPFEIESSFSLIPDSKPIQLEDSKNTALYPIEQSEKDALWEQYIQNQQNLNQQIGQTGQQTSDYFRGENGSEESYELPLFHKDFMNKIVKVISWVWLAGSFGLAIYAVFSFLSLKRKIAASILLYNNVYLCDEIDTPFVLGILKPCIYLSSKTPEEMWENILIHEKAHLKRGDHLWKIIGYVLLVIYWFNPLSWAAYLLFCKDLELACDEKATKDMDKNQRADYCQALLTCSMNPKKLDVCPVAFGEVGVKERIKQVLNYKKPSFWMILLTVMACVVVLVCFMTNPESKEDVTNYENMEETSEVASEFGGQKATENTTEYDHIEPDEQGYRWLSDEVYVYEFEDLDQNGVEEYAKVYQIDTEQEYICRYTFYWNGEAVYEYENSYGMFPGDAQYLDLDGDEEKEIFLTFWPKVNSMPLMEYIVLKQKTDMSWEPLEMIHGEEIYQNAFPISITKGKNEWEAVISCGDLEKKIIFDLAFYRSKLEEQWEKEESEYKEYLETVISDYKRGFPEESEWYTFGSVCAWGIWNIKSGEYQGQPCLIATHGIQGYDKFDFWGELDVYFDYDAQGKTRFLDMKFRNSESWAGKVEFTMEDLISLCDAGGKTLKSVLTDFNENIELPYSNFEKKIFEYDWSYFCYLVYGEREYRLQVSYELSDQYGFKMNELNRVNLYYPETGDAQLLYANEKRFAAPPVYNLDVRSFLEKEYDVNLYVELDLPDNLRLGNYHMDLTLGQGCLFEGDYEEIPHGEGTPKDWYAPGGIEFIKREYFPGEIRFKDGKLEAVMVHMNHSGSSSEFEFLEECDMQAVLCEYSCDLFTAAESEEYMQAHGISEEEFQWNSRYWYVFFAEEDSEYVYTLMLNQEYFDKEDIVELARSVEFRVK